MKKLSFHNLGALFLLLLLVCAVPVMAQEELEPSRETQRENQDDPPESDSKVNTKSTPGTTTREAGIRDSTAVKPLVTKKPENKAQPEEDILTFNFLYYIIHRFKLSDIVD